MNSKCNFCNELVIEKDVANDNYVQCASCMTPSHRECYHANKAKCMTMGCNGESVYMTPKPTTLPAKLEQMALAECGKNIGQERNLPALTPYIEQEDRIDKIIKQYGYRKNSINGGTVEILESVYYCPNKPGTHLREIGESFLNEYSKLEKKLEDIKKQIDEAENATDMSFFTMCFGMWAVGAYITGNYSMLFATGAISIANYGVRKFLNDKKLFMLKNCSEELQRQGLRDLREKYAPRFYISEQADKNDDADKQAHNKELEKAQRTLEELRQKATICVTKINDMNDPDLCDGISTSLKSKKR